MSELLQTWVLQETGIQLAELSQDFSTGYKLGEVLAKLNLQPDFDMFQHHPTPEAMINNFTRLQPTLKSLGIKFDTRRANALVREDKGAASQLLYEIRSAVQEHRDHVKSTSSPPLGKTLGVKGNLNRTLLQVQQHRNKLGSYEKFQGDHFEELMRQHAANPKAMSMELHVQRFTDEGSRQAAAAVASEKASQEMAERNRRAFHDSCTDRSAAARKKAADLEDRVVKIHTASQQYHRELKEKDARGARAAKQKAAARKQAALEAETNEMIRSIQSFEEKLEKSGMGKVGGDSAGDEVADCKATFGTTPLDQAQRLKQFLPDTQKMQREAEEYMQRLHDRRKSNVKAAKERRVRRHKLLQEEAAATEAAQRQEDKASALKALNRHSEEEQRIEERLSQLSAEEAVLVANREQRLAQYSERRQQDHSDAIKREEELSKSLKGQVSEEVERERRQWRREREKRAQQKRDKHQSIAQRVAHELVGLALLNVEYNKRNGVPAPSKVKREWLAMFLAGDSRLCSEDTQLDEKALQDVDETIDGAMMREYMCFEGDWAQKSQDPTTDGETADQQVSERKDDDVPSAFNLPLGAAVHAIRVIAQPPPPDAAPTLNLPVRMAVVGGPFTGKTTLAQTLAEAQNATVIVPENLVQSAILAAAQYIEPQAQIVEEEVECESGDELDPPHDPDATAATSAQEDSAAKPETTNGDQDAAADGEETTKKKKRIKLVSRTIDPPPPPRQVEIGRRAQEVLLDGEQMSDDDTAALVAECILQLQTDYNNWKQSNPEDSGNADSKPSCPQGFILDGYPRSANQAMTLERELTGLDLSSEIEYAAGASTVAPPPPGTFRSPSRPLKSCLDSVVMLELEDAEAAVSRAVGRRMDPTTGAIYHMDLSPPPGDVPGLLERLQPVKSVSNDTEQVQKRLQVHLQATPPLRKWLQRFDRLLWTISADASPPDVAKQALAIAEIARDSKDAALRCIAAAASADAARKTAELAAEHAKQAQQASLATVRELFVAKRAEVEAEQLVRQQGATDPKAKDAKAKKGAAEPDPEAQKIANAASALLAEQAAQQCAEHLAAGEAANQQAHERAEEAAAAAQAAVDAAMEAKRSIHDADKSCEAEVRAREAAAAAEVAAEGAAAAAAVASASAERATQIVSSAQEKLHGPVEELADTAALLEQEAEADAAQAEAAEAEAEQQPPVVQMQELDAAAAERLYEMWRMVEKSYIRGGKLAFSGLRRLRQDHEDRMYESHQVFAEYLVRPDDRQAAVTQYQMEVNEIDLDIINEPEVKAELALRVEELRDKLWGMCDTKMEENTKMRSELIDPAIQESTITDFSQCLSGLAQVELDRFTQTAAIARECACLRFNLPTAMFPKLELVDILGDTDGDLAPLLDAKTGIAIPEWAIVPNMATLTNSLKRAVAALVRDERNTFKDAGSPAAPPKKGAKPPADAALAAEVAPEVLEAAESFCGAILEHERSLTRARLQGIAARATIDSSDAKTLLTATAERLQTALKDRFVAECEAVASVVVVLAEAVVKGEQLPYDLQLGDDSVIIDMDNRHIPEEPEVKLRPPSPGPLAPGLLSLKQISCLIRVAQQVTRDEFMALRDCTDLLQSLTSDHGARYGVAFPPEWHKFTWEQMHGAITPMDAQGSCYIDWLEMTTGLLIHARPVLTHVTPRNLADAAIALEAADSDKDGSVTLQEWMDCPIWFQPNLPFPVEDTDPVDEALDVVEMPPDDVLIPATDQVQDDPVAASEHIKKILWELFSTGRTYPDPEDDAFAFGVLPGTAATPEADADTTEQARTPEPQALNPESAESGVENEIVGNTAETAGQEEPASATSAADNNSQGAAGPASDSNKENKPSDERKMPFIRMLLYLCADYELPLAMHKAFSVIAKDPSPRVKLQAPDIFRILYPNGDSGKGIFKIPCEEPEVTEIIARISGVHVEVEEEPRSQIMRDAKAAKAKAAGKDKGGAKDKGAKKGAKAEEAKEKPDVEAIAEVTSDQFVYHSRGAALLESCGSRYKLRDLFLDCRRIKPYDM